MLLSIEELEKLSNCEGVGRNVLEKRIRILVDHIKKERFESEMDKASLRGLYDAAVSRIKALQKLKTL